MYVEVSRQNWCNRSTVPTLGWVWTLCDSSCSRDRTQRRRARLKRDLPTVHCMSSGRIGRRIRLLPRSTLYYIAIRAYALIGTQPPA